jgi:hypothetical protein
MTSAGRDDVTFFSASDPWLGALVSTMPKNKGARAREQEDARRRPHADTPRALSPLAPLSYVRACVRVGGWGWGCAAWPVRAVSRGWCAGKGGKNRRRGKNENEGQKRELVFKEDGQEYGQVNKMLGNGRLEAACFDGVNRLCHIRGKLRKKARRAHTRTPSCREREREKVFACQHLFIHTNVHSTTSPPTQGQSVRRKERLGACAHAHTAPCTLPLC